TFVPGATMRSRLPLRLDTSTVTRPPSTFSTTVRPMNASISPLTSLHRRSSTGIIGAVAAIGAAVGDGAAVGTTPGGTAMDPALPDDGATAAVAGAGAA